MANKIGYRATNWVAFSIVTLANFACGYIKNYYLFIIVYAGANGIGCGLGYLMGMYIAWTYFPTIKPVITGSILFCAGVSASIFTPIQTYIINPDNLDKNDPKVINNVPKLFTYIGIIYTVLTVLSCLLQPAPFESDNFKKK